MTILEVIAKKPVNLGKQPNGDFIYWTASDVKNKVSKKVEVTNIIERYIDLGFLEIVKKQEKKPTKEKKTKKKSKE